MKITFSALAIVAALGVAAQASAQSSDTSSIAIGVGAGTLGGGVSGSVALGRSLVVRAEGNFLSLNEGFNSTDVHYSGRLRFNTAAGFAELHPAGGPFFAAVGVVGGDRKTTVKGSPTSGTVQTFKINGVTYSISQIAQLNGSIDLGSSAPYVGVGFDNTFAHRGHWGLRIAAGVAAGVSPSVSLTATGPLASDPIVQSNLKAEQASLSHDVKDFRYYPVVEIGLSRRF